MLMRRRGRRVGEELKDAGERRGLRVAEKGRGELMCMLLRNFWGLERAINQESAVIHSPGLSRSQGPRQVSRGTPDPFARALKPCCCQQAFA